MLNNKETIHIKADIVLREEDDGAFLFDPDTGRICYLNGLGVVIWRLCENPITQEQIVRELSLEYTDVTAETISKDCSTFLDHLYQFGFLST